ncbi:DUF433 domain-containing protein [candidate division CSSED10-310 bacterium]|uniref:DUF433 domain-containing protein n=1 Tax=candidate division CSSED10-310 bacterium TaxID=2855610 RepID=A0ABV6Z3J0_UNCC1
MARYPLKLPSQLKEDAEQWALRQGISLNQFIMWAVAEKVGSLKNRLDDPAFPHISYRRGASGAPEAVVSGTGIRVQTIVLAHTVWNQTDKEIAGEYDLSERIIQEALGFYKAHRTEIDSIIKTEAEIEEAVGQAETSS